MNSTVAKLHDLASDLLYCDRDSLAGKLMHEAANEISRLIEDGRKCTISGCGNAVRYIDAWGRLVCGVCPVKQHNDSIRISDVPKLVAWARDIVKAHREHGYVELDVSDIDAVAELLGKKP